MDFETRQARQSDVDAIADAHLDSIRSIGPRFYPPQTVEDWAFGLTRDVYLRAMNRGEVFFIAVGMIDGKPAVLGFSSDYRIDGSKHGTSAYVRGGAARRGVGSTLLRLAEAHAIGSGATSIHIEASLAGVEFYRSHGYVETSRTQTRLRSGRTIECVVMHKKLAVTMQMNAYLSFKGQCEAAFKFYEKHLGGQLGPLFRYAGTPLANQVPADWQDKVMHGSVTVRGEVLMGGDVAPDRYEEPKGFSLSIHTNNAAEAERIFHALADGGKIVVPLEKTFWAARFGMVVDRFGIPWMINAGESEEPATT